MTERELSERLRTAVLPVESDAEQRGWRLASAAYGARSRAPRSRYRQRRMTVPTLAGVLVLAVATVAGGSAPRHAVARWLREALGVSSAPPVRAGLPGLPTAGELLVNAPSGPWIVSSAGARRYLGHYAGAAWSPHSRYVVAWRGAEVSALDLHGRPQWVRAAAAAGAAGAAVSVARWSPDGFRIAYVAGAALEVVAGDGSGTHLLSGAVRPVAPAWEPGAVGVHRIAFVDARGEIELRNADSGAMLWRRRAPQPPRQLLWSADGQRLVAVSPHTIVVYDAAGRRRAARTFGGGQHVGNAVLAGRDRLAVIIGPAGGGAGDVVAAFTATRAGLTRPARIVFAAAQSLSDLAWSPDDRWLVATSGSADQWIFLRVGGRAPLFAVGRVAARFAPGSHPAGGAPRLGGWQAAATGP